MIFLYFWGWNFSAPIRVYFTGTVVSTCRNTQKEKIYWEFFERYQRIDWGFFYIWQSTNVLYFDFSLPIGFFWQTIENEEFQSDVNMHADDIEYETQNTISLVYKKVYRYVNKGILSRFETVFCLHWWCNKTVTTSTKGQGPKSCRKVSHLLKSETRTSHLKAIEITLKHTTWNSFMCYPLFPCPCSGHCRV